MTLNENTNSEDADRPTRTPFDYEFMDSARRGWFVQIAAFLGPLKEFHIPKGYQDETGFHFGSLHETDDDNYLKI